MLRRIDSYFMTVVKTGSLSRAAELLYTTQPSVTKAVHRLEEELGCALFSRSSKPMQLNEAGRLYYDYLCGQIAGEQQLRDRLAELNLNESGTLRVGIPPYCLQCFFPMVLKQFIQRYPRVRLELTETTGDHIEEALLSREIDLGIMHPVVRKPRLAYEELFGERILLAVPRRDLPRTEDAPLELRQASLKDFFQEPFMLPTVDQKLGQVVRELFAGAGFTPNILFRSPNATLLLYLAANGVGSCFIPESGLSLQSDRVLEHIIFYHLDELAGHDWRLAAVRRRDYEYPAYTAYFLTLLGKYKPLTPAPARSWAAIAEEPER